MKETQQRNEVQSTLLELEEQARNHSTMDKLEAMALQAIQGLACDMGGGMACPMA